MLEQVILGLGVQVASQQEPQFAHRQLEDDRMAVLGFADGAEIRQGVLPVDLLRHRAQDFNLQAAIVIDRSRAFPQRLLGGVHLVERIDV